MNRESRRLAGILLIILPRSRLCSGDSRKAAGTSLSTIPLLIGSSFQRCWPEGMVFPHDFGFVPSTKGADGDPIDILVLGDEPTFPGCSLECRLLGSWRLNRKQWTRKRNFSRLIAVAEQSAEMSYLES